MSATDPVQAYRETQIKTANQIKLIVMLYDGAIRHLNLALEDLTGSHGTTTGSTTTSWRRRTSSRS